MLPLLPAALPAALPVARTAPEARGVLDALAAGGAEARFVGGCVRDALLGRPLRDLDIATDAPPGRVTELLRGAGLKVVPTGIEHGTVTAISGGRPFEITTLRRDVETDGRRAVVAFTDDWREDAARRDFTMNAMSLSSDGTLHDYFGGAGDARAGLVRFVGDPELRIREDVLRILRFFRFQAHYGRTSPDETGLRACASLAGLLPALSGERVRTELLRLLEAGDPAPVWRLMTEQGVLAPLLPEASDISRLEAMVGLERAEGRGEDRGEGRGPDALRRLAALLPDSLATAADVAERLKLSNRDRDRLGALAQPPVEVRPASDGTDNRRALRRVGAERFVDHVLMAAATQRLDHGAIEPAMALAATWRPVTFPLKGRDLLKRGVAPGPDLGRLLAGIEAWWEEHDYRPGRDACLGELDRRLGRAP